MLGPAKRRGIEVVRGAGESLPFKDGAFDFALIVFVLEFVDDLKSFLGEASRVLRRGGALVAGLIDRDSEWGRHFHESSEARRFFHPPSPPELIDILTGLGLEPRGAWQALFGPPPDLQREEEPRTGFGRGGFVVLRADKSSAAG
jgi:SAM-dependent methyltransferase